MKNNQTFPLPQKPATEIMNNYLSRKFEERISNSTEDIVELSESEAASLFDLDYERSKPEYVKRAELAECELSARADDAVEE